MTSSRWLVGGLFLGPFLLTACGSGSSGASDDSVDDAARMDLDVRVPSDGSSKAEASGASDGSAGKDTSAAEDAFVAEASASDGSETTDAEVGGDDGGSIADASANEGSVAADASGHDGAGAVDATSHDATSTADAAPPVDSGGGSVHGNPNGSCSAGIPAKGQPVDTSNSTVVGMGNAASCTFSALNAAVEKGGIITFNCGSAPVTLAITATMNLPITKNTVIDGGNKVTLDGGGTVQILNFNSPNFQVNENGLTLQHISLVNGKQTPTLAIPKAPAPCSQGWDDGEGGALYMRDGNLTVIDASFSNNQAAPLGPDTGGGAIYLLGSKHGALIVSSTFTSNKASNAGAVGGLFAELDIYNSVFTGNSAIGSGANNDDPTMCSVMNNGQNEIGSGGNGGAIYSDGNSVNVTLCGDEIDDNTAGANAFGGGLFFTSDDMMGILAIADTTMKGNTGGSWTNVSSGSVTNVGTAIGVNAASITVTNSTLQGVP